MNQSDESQNDENAETRTPGDSWSRVDFESALPLYVGGDLDPADAAFVDAWITRHPADRALLDAAQVARDVLSDHGERTRALPTPDLWPAVRVELARAGAFTKGASVSDAPSHASKPERSIPASEHGRRAPKDGPVPRPVLGGVRWFQRRGVAAAAAVLLAATVGFLLVDTGDPATPPGGSGFTANSPEQPVFTGAPASVRLAGSNAGTRLSRPGLGAKHLVDEATSIPFWQLPNEMPTIQLLPSERQQNPAELVGGNR